MTENKTTNIVDKGRDIIVSSRVYRNIRRRSRQEWLEFYKTNFTKFYNLLTDDGERALLAGVVCGVLAVFLFKEILLLVFLVLLAGGAVWIISDDATVSIEEPKGTDADKDPQ